MQVRRNSFYASKRRRLSLRTLDNNNQMERLEKFFDGSFEQNEADNTIPGKYV